jgi:hypothetical protein
MAQEVAQKPLEVNVVGAQVEGRREDAQSHIPLRRLGGKLVGKLKKELLDRKNRCGRLSQFRLELGDIHQGFQQILQCA